MFENGHIYYFPFAIKMLIALLVLALPWDKWLSFLPSFIKRGFVSYRQFLAPVAQDEAHKWYFFLTRLTLSLIIFLLPIAYDFYVPEVAGDLRWYMMHSSGLALCVLFFIYQIERYKTQRTMQLSIQLPFTSWMVIITVLFGFLTLTWGESLPSNWWFLKHLMGYALIFAFALQARHLQWYNNLFWLLAASVSFNAIFCPDRCRYYRHIPIHAKLGGNVPKFTVMAHFRLLPTVRTASGGLCQQKPCSFLYGDDHSADGLPDAQQQKQLKTCFIHHRFDIGMRVLALHKVSGQLGKRLRRPCLCSHLALLAQTTA